MRAPQGGDAIEQRQRGVGVLGDVEHREIVSDEGVTRHADGRCHHDELPGHGGRDRRDPAVAAVAGTGNAEKCLQRRQQQRQHQCELTQFRQHQLLPPRRVGPLRWLLLCFRRAQPRAACTSRRAWRALRPRRRRLAPKRPCATTPWPSRNRSGRTRVASPAPRV